MELSTEVQSVPVYACPLLFETPVDTTCRHVRCVLLNSHSTESTPQMHSICSQLKEQATQHEVHSKHHQRFSDSA